MKTITLHHSYELMTHGLSAEMIRYGRLILLAGFGYRINLCDNGAKKYFEITSKIDLYPDSESDEYIYGDPVNTWVESDKVTGSLYYFGDNPDHKTNGGIDMAVYIAITMAQLRSNYPNKTTTPFGDTFDAVNSKYLFEANGYHCHLVSDSGISFTCQKGVTPNRAPFVVSVESGYVVTHTDDKKYMTFDEVTRLLLLKDLSFLDAPSVNASGYDGLVPVG